jgi:hypothetical protein
LKPRPRSSVSRTISAGIQRFALISRLLIPSRAFSVPDLARDSGAELARFKVKAVVKPVALARKWQELTLQVSINNCEFPLCRQQASSG